MIKCLEWINHFVWGVPTLLLILVVGIYLSIRTGFVQITFLPKAIRSFIVKFTDRTKRSDGVSPYQALCTALAATVGTGNIAGVAGAIALGGPGAVFWMWVCAFLGMCIKYAEASLAVRYRVKSETGEWIGGPMYMISRGLGSKWFPLASAYCFFAVVAAFGVGNATQVNAVIGSIGVTVESLGGSTSRSLDIVIGAILALVTAMMLSGGAKRIGSIAERLVPYASVLYILLCLGVLIARMDRIGSAFSSIIYGAFSPEAVTGGAIGSVFISLRIGASRGVFTNEAGMGTASIAHAAADVSHPAEQGLMGIMEVFLDTIVICTMTALAVLCSGIEIPFGFDAGAVLTTQAFSAVYGNWVCIPIALCLCCFAVATILGWGLYGARCAQFLFGHKVWHFFVALQVVTVFISVLLKTGTVWMLAETVNGLMAVPNLLALFRLSPELIKLTKEYKAGSFSAAGGTYENFHQCKSLRTFSNAEVPSAGGQG